MCVIGDEAFKRRLVYSVALTICFIASVLKYKASLNKNLNLYVILCVS